MKIKLDNDVFEGNYLLDKYSKYASEEYKIEGVPYINFPFEIENIEEDNKYLSWILIDHDSNPVVNFSWIHWLVANYKIESNLASIPEHLCNTNKPYIKGNNSFSCPLANIKDEKVYLNYGGPTPPDKDHNYTLVVYAHNAKLDVNDGFFYNDLLDCLEQTTYKVASIKITACC